MCFELNTLLAITVVFSWHNAPKITPTERAMMKGLRLPRFELHLSDMDPMIGARKNPINGDKHQIMVMCSCRTPER